MYREIELVDECAAPVGEPDLVGGAQLCTAPRKELVETLRAVAGGCRDGTGNNRDVIHGARSYRAPWLHAPRRSARAASRALETTICALAGPFPRPRFFGRARKDFPTCAARVIPKKPCMGVDRMLESGRHDHQAHRELSPAPSRKRVDARLGFASRSARRHLSSPPSLAVLPTFRVWEEGQGTSMSTSVSQAKLLAALESAATLGIVRSFLKAKRLPSSAGSWDVMRSDRLVPALRDSTVRPDELLRLISECEEHGRQHVFLYDLGRKAAARACDPVRVQDELRRKGLVALLQAPRLVEIPAQPEIVDVRCETVHGEASLVVKAVEVRTHWEPREPVVESETMTRKWDLVRERAVNLVRVRASGLLEARIYRQRNSTDYETPLQDFFEMIYDVAGTPKLSKLQVLSIAKAKEYIFKHGKKLSGKIDTAQFRAKNQFGIENRITAGTTDGSLADDPGSVDGMSAFVAEDGQHTGTFATWRGVDGDPDSEDIFVALNGAPNEFAIGHRCREADYERVLADILKFNA